MNCTNNNLLGVSLKVGSEENKLYSMDDIVSYFSNKQNLETILENIKNECKLSESNIVEYKYS